RDFHVTGVQTCALPIWEQAREGQQSYANMISYLDEALSGVKIIKAFNAIPFVKDRFNGESERYSKILRRMVRRQQMSSPVSELLGVVDRKSKRLNSSHVKNLLAVFCLF